MALNSKWGGGKTLVGGTAFDIPFSKGVPLSTITPGAILYLNESGSPVPFYIAKHDYESGLNGTGRTLLVRKDCYDERSFGNSNNYESSFLSSWLCNTWIKMLDTNVVAEISNTKFYSCVGNGSNEIKTLQRTVFQLSIAELGLTGSSLPAEGSALPTARILRTASYNGAGATQWTRSPRKSNTVLVCTVDAGGNSTGYDYSSYKASRPAFTLPSTIVAVKNPDGTYTLAA